MTRGYLGLVRAARAQRQSVKQKERVISRLRSRLLDRIRTPAAIPPAFAFGLVLGTVLPGVVRAMGSVLLSGRRVSALLHLVTSLVRTTLIR